MMNNRLELYFVYFLSKCFYIEHSIQSHHIRNGDDNLHVYPLLSWGRQTEAWQPISAKRPLRPPTRPLETNLHSVYSYKFTKHPDNLFLFIWLSVCNLFIYSGSICQQQSLDQCNAVQMLVWTSKQYKIVSAGPTTFIMARKWLLCHSSKK